MLQSTAPSKRRPVARLLICGFGAFPGFADNPASGVISQLIARDWAPEGVRTAYRRIPTTWADGHRTATAAARDFGPDGVMVVGVAGGADRFRVETQGRNRVGVDRADAAGAFHPGALISEQGPALAAARAPVAAMVAAIEREGLPAEASSDAGDYLCNYVFYRLLTETPARPTAFLHLPPDLSLEDLQRGAQAAATAFALALKPAPARPRGSPLGDFDGV